MTRISTAFVLWLIAAALPGAADAQPRSLPPGPATQPSGPTVPPTPPVVEAPFDPFRSRESVVRIGQDYSLRPGEEVREVAVIAGNAELNGRVDGDVVVVVGNVRLASTAIIDGNLAVIAGSAIVSEGARVDGDIVIVGGGVDGPTTFAPGREYVVIGTTAIGGRLSSLAPWMTRGLLWGRPIVPELTWIWGVVGFVFLLYLLLTVVFEQPVRACADQLGEKPLTTFAVGLLVLLLAGPVCVLLAVSVVGLAIIPFVGCALLVGGFVGKAGTQRWIGRSVVAEESPVDKLQALRSFAIGFAVILVAYMIPIVGFATMAIVSVFGLGAAALAFLAAFKKESPAPPRGTPAAPMTPSLPPPAPPSYDASPQPEPMAAQAVVPPSPPAPADRTGDLVAFPKAPFLDRLAAFVLDVILVTLTLGILGLLDGEGPMFFIVWLAYTIGFRAWKGTTVGGIICQLRVVRIDGRPLAFPDALVRGLASIFSALVLFIGYVWMVRDPERQTWHDRIAGTYVVKVPRNWPI